MSGMNLKIRVLFLLFGAPQKKGSGGKVRLDKTLLCEKEQSSKSVTDDNFRDYGYFGKRKTSRLNSIKWL